MNKTIKKAACILSAISVMSASSVTLAAGYYNASSEVNQIRSFMRRGMYLEVIRDSGNTIAWHNLSPDDTALLQGYSAEASKRYNDYINGTGAYYNAYAEINQIRSFVNRGLYVEAMQNAEQTLDWHYLSPADIATVNSLYDSASSKYREYRSRPKYAVTSQARAKELVRNSFDSYYRSDLSLDVYDETSQGYYVEVMWRNEVTGNYNFWGNYSVNRYTGAVSQVY